MALEIDVDEDMHAGAHEEHPPTTIRQYILIGALLTVVTVIELWASYNEHILGGTLVPALLVMSLFKFVVVVALFMHLKFESRLLTRLFMFALILATCIMLALMALFARDAGGTGRAGTAIRPAAEAPAAPAH